MYTYLKRGVVDANVYGVQVPGKDGRACMVAITLEAGVGEIDMDKLESSFSIPQFL